METTNIKEKSLDFVTEFKAEVEANRAEFESRGINLDYGDDIGVFFYAGFEYYKSNAEKREDFVIKFFLKHRLIISDLLANSAFHRKKKPMRLTLSYDDKIISAVDFGPEIYSYGVYKDFYERSQQFADMFIISEQVLTKYVEGDTYARQYLMSHLDFQSVRNWTISWAKMSWVKLAFPSIYEKMIKDEFLSVEELEAKMNEAMAEAEKSI
jgi:hypothetical protein